MDSSSRLKLEGRTSHTPGDQGNLWPDVAVQGVGTGAAEAGLHAMEDEQRCGVSWDECPQHLCGCRWLETGEP